MEKVEYKDMFPQRIFAAYWARFARAKRAQVRGNNALQYACIE